MGSSGARDPNQGGETVADSTNSPVPPDSREHLLAEAFRQIGQVWDLLVRAAASLPAPPPPPDTGGGIPAAAGFERLADVTDYTFRTPATVGSRVTVRRVPDPAPAEQLRPAGQADAHRLADRLGAEDLAVAPHDTLPS